jgi:hypothetical protein
MAPRASRAPRLPSAAAWQASQQGCSPQSRALGDHLSAPQGLYWETGGETLAAEIETPARSLALSTPEIAPPVVADVIDFLEDRFQRSPIGPFLRALGEHKVTFPTALDRRVEFHFFGQHEIRVIRLHKRRREKRTDFQRPANHRAASGRIRTGDQPRSSEVTPNLTTSKIDGRL